MHQDTSNSTANENHSTIFERLKEEAHANIALNLAKQWQNSKHHIELILQSYTDNSNNTLIKKKKQPCQKFQFFTTLDFLHRRQLNDPHPTAATVCNKTR